VPASASHTGGERAGPLSALSVPSFRWYFLGQLAFVSGTFLQSTALGWLVLQLTGSATSLGLVRAASSLPTLVLGPWGGVVADRLDPRQLLLATQVTFALLAALPWVLALRGQVGVGWLVMISLATGLVSRRRRARAPDLRRCARPARRARQIAWFFVKHQGEATIKVTLTWESGTAPEPSPSTSGSLGSSDSA
jgi:MFS family permease